MAPPHVSAFQKFKAQIPNRLEAEIAFGLFMQSESIWAATEGEPSEIRYRRYQEQFLTDHEIERFAQQARALLSDFGTEAVAVKRAEFLQENLERYESAAGRGHREFRGYGIWEAFLGALAWTAFLIAISFLLKYTGIDLIEIYNKVAAH
jgi:hypothetical protein